MSIDYNLFLLLSLVSHWVMHTDFSMTNDAIQRNRGTCKSYQPSFHDNQKRDSSYSRYSSSFPSETVCPLLLIVDWRVCFTGKKKKNQGYIFMARFSYRLLSKKLPFFHSLIRESFDSYHRPFSYFSFSFYSFKEDLYHFLYKRSFKKSYKDAETYVYLSSFSCFWKRPRSLSFIIMNACLLAEMIGWKGKARG